MACCYESSWESQTWLLTGGCVPSNCLNPKPKPCVPIHCCNSLKTTAMMSRQLTRALVHTDMLLLMVWSVTAMVNRWSSQLPSATYPPPDALQQCLSTPK